MSYYHPTEFEDFFNSQLSTVCGWREYFSDAYDAAEGYITGISADRCQEMLDEIDALLGLDSEAARRAAIPFVIEDLSEEPGEFDAFLLAFRGRVERELAGDRSQPLVDPRPKKGGPVSPQGYDITLVSAGTFPNEPIANAVVKAVVQAYDSQVRAFMADARRGVTRRFPPMRMRFDQEVGTVAVRDAGEVGTRLAVVLLHDVGGEPRVFSAFPVEPLPEPPRFEALSVLFGGWLHADWVDEFDGAPDPVEQVRRFAAAEPVETVEQAAVELAALLSRGSEQDRRQAVRGLCGFFLPRPPGQLDRFLAEAGEVLAR